jgi:hypothetical protein
MRTPSAKVNRSPGRSHRTRLGVLTVVALAGAAIVPAVTLTGQASAGTLLPGLLSPLTKAGANAAPSLGSVLSSVGGSLNTALSPSGPAGESASAGVGGVLSQAAGVAPNLPEQASSLLQTLSSGTDGAPRIEPTLVNAPASQAPATPTNVKASQAGSPPDLTVSWANGSGGAAVEGAVVQLGTEVAGIWTYVTQVKCGDCTSTTLRELNFGSAYQAKVYSFNAAGVGHFATSPVVTLKTSCTAGACVSLNALDSLGSANHAASGLLSSLYPEANDGADLKALGTAMYRGSLLPVGTNAFNWSSFDVAITGGAKTIVNLDGIQKAENASPPTPWSNWSNYAAWVTTTVHNLVASGKQVNYIEVYNEPGGNNGFYSAAGYASETPALLLKQFLVAYNAIKAADPFAQVVGPDLEHWSDYPGQYGTSDHSFDMVTFLNYAVANHIQLAALSWHEIDDNLGPNPEENTLDPAVIEDHVAEAKALLAARPSLGNPQIFIDEYGMPEVQSIPGWDVGYLAALTDAKVNSATRACWAGACNEPVLDGLLFSNGTSPLSDFYVRTIYAAMSGEMVSTSTNSDTVSALGSYNSLTGKLTGLIGRGVGCSQNLLACEPSFVDASRAGGTPVTVTLTVPWSSGSSTLTLTHVSGSSPLLPAAAPSVSTQTVKAVSAGLGKGTITFTIPNFQDGDAWGISITH